MDKHQIASLGCKFLGIYALLESIKLFANIIQMYAFAHVQPEFGLSLKLSTSIPFIFMISSAIALIVFSKQFANKMAGPTIEGNMGSAFALAEVQSVAFSIIGLILLLMALPKVAQVGWNIYAMKSAGDESNTAEILRGTWSFALATGIQFIIGLVLFIGADLFFSIVAKGCEATAIRKNYYLRFNYQVLVRWFEPYANALKSAAKMHQPDLEHRELSGNPHESRKHLLYFYQTPIGHPYRRHLHPFEKHLLGQQADPGRG